MMISNSPKTNFKSAGLEVLPKNYYARFICMGTFPTWNQQDADEYGGWSVKFAFKDTPEAMGRTAYAFFKMQEEAMAYTAYLLEQDFRKELKAYASTEQGREQPHVAITCRDMAGNTGASEIDIRDEEGSGQVSCTTPSNSSRKNKIIKRSSKRNKSDDQPTN